MSYKAEIPYGAYWSTPFARRQGSFANLHSIEFAAHVAKLPHAPIHDIPAVREMAAGFTAAQCASLKERGINAGC